MTITRRWQSGAEADATGADESEWTREDLATSTVRVKTGTYSFSGNYGERDVPATRQLRVAMHACPAGSPSGTPYIFSVRTGITTVLLGVWAKDAATLALMVNGVEQDTCAFNSNADIFFHLGLDVKIDSGAGWAVFYIDGAEAMRFEGNTGNNDISTVRIGAQTLNTLLIYRDDLYIDDLTSQGAAAPCPDRRFPYVTPNGAGYHKEGLGSDGNNTDNHLLVDDAPHDSDTTYVVLDAADERETNQMTTYTLPTGFAIAAVIPVIFAKKTDAEIDTQLAPLLRYDSTDLEGAAVALGSSYTMQWERFTTKPGGGAWDQAALDGLEIGYQGEGTF
jgi:hypothetical protein